MKLLVRSGRWQPHFTQIAGVRSGSRIVDRSRPKRLWRTLTRRARTSRPVNDGVAAGPCMGTDQTTRRSIIAPPVTAVQTGGPVRISQTEPAARALPVFAQPGATYNWAATLPPASGDEHITASLYQGPTWYTCWGVGILPPPHPSDAGTGTAWLPRYGAEVQFHVARVLGWSAYRPSTLVASLPGGRLPAESKIFFPRRCNHFPLPRRTETTALRQKEWVKDWHRPK